MTCGQYKHKYIYIVVCTSERVCYAKQIACVRKQNKKEKNNTIKNTYKVWERELLTVN